MKFSRKPKRRGGTRKMRGGNIFRHLWEWIKTLWKRVFGENITSNEAQVITISLVNSNNVDTLINASEQNDVTTIRGVLTEASAAKRIQNLVRKKINKTLPKNITEFLKKIMKTWKNKKEDRFCFWDGVQWFDLGIINNIEIDSINDFIQIVFHTQKGEMEKSYNKNSDKSPIIIDCKNATNIMPFRNESLMNIFWKHNEIL